MHSFLLLLSLFLFPWSVASFSLAPYLQQQQTTTTTTTTLKVMRDEYLQPHFQQPTVVAATENVDRMVECATSDDLCDVSEMQRLIAELDSVNQGGMNDTSKDKECESNNNRNQVLKQALSLQLELQQTRAAIQGFQQNQRQTKNLVDRVVHHDHSFDHFVDYRSMGEFESH